MSTIPPNETPEQKKVRMERFLDGAKDWVAKNPEKADPNIAFKIAKEKLAATLDTLPDKAIIPYEKTPEGERAAEFNRVCDEKFNLEVDFTKVRNRAAYDRMLDWNGLSPGICGTGVTGMGKTFAAWQTLRRQYVVRSRTFGWFTVRRLLDEMASYEKIGGNEAFFRQVDFNRIIFIDDLDKINWDFISEQQTLFAFFDWAYRKQKPLIATTNRDRSWWKAKMGDAFVRRLFDDGMMEIRF